MVLELIVILSVARPAVLVLLAVANLLRWMLITDPHKDLSPSSLVLGFDQMIRRLLYKDLFLCMSQQILPLILATLSFIKRQIVTRRPFEELINIAHQIRAIVVAVRVFLVRYLVARCHPRLQNRVSTLSFPLTLS